MGFIKQIKLPNNEVQYMKNTIIPVIGTQTSSTSSWTGNIDLPSLYDGLTIAYFLPYASASGTNVTLKLTLNNGSQTLEIPCYISSSRLTTHYAKGTNIIMTYWSAGSIKIDGTATDNDRWIAHADYNTNTDTKVTQTNTATDESYRLLFSGTADDTTKTEEARKSSKLQFNPSNCTLTFYNETTTSDDIPITFDFDIKDTETGKTYSTNAYMKWYQDHGTTTSGLNMVIQSGGGMFLGGGEAPNKHYLAKTTDNTDPNNPVHRNYTNEETFITSDSSIHIQSNAGTITNRKGLQINNSLQLVPEQEDVATNNIGSIGTSSYRWANGYFTQINGVTVGDTPVFTDTWTALTGATSSANGSVGYINAVPPKNGYNTKFFRADGSWAIPANDNYYHTTGSWSELTYTATANGGAGALEFTIPTGTTSSTVAVGNHKHGNIQNNGTLQTNDITIANGDKLIVTDSSNSSKVARTSISFDGSTTTKCLTQKGTWESFTDTDEKVKNEIGTSNTFYPAGGTSNSTGTGTQVFDASIKFAGTTNGKAQLVLGNSTADGTEGGRFGQISIYSKSTSYGNLLQANVSSSVTHTFPATGGTILNTGNYDDYALPLTGGTLTGALSLKSNNLDITDTTINTTGKSIYFYDKNDVQIGHIKMLERTGGTIDTQIIASRGTNIYNLLRIRLPADATGGVINTLPNTGGTILNSGTTSFTQELDSGTKIGTIKINDTITDLYCETNIDTKNTASSTNTSSKIFLIGATSQTTGTNSIRTYSHDTVYAGTDGHLYSNSKQAVNLSDSQTLTNKTLQDCFFFKTKTTSSDLDHPDILLTEEFVDTDKYSFRLNMTSGQINYQWTQYNGNTNTKKVRDTISIGLNGNITIANDTYTLDTSMQGRKLILGSGSVQTSNEAGTKKTTIVENGITTGTISATTTTSTNIYTNNLYSKGTAIVVKDTLSFASGAAIKMADKIAMQIYTENKVNCLAVGIDTMKVTLYGSSYYLSSGAAITSDKRLKTNIEIIDNRYLNLIKNLEPKRFKLKNNPEQKYHTGFIAQDVQELLKKYNINEEEFAAFARPKGDDSEYALSYTEFIPLLLLYIKDLEKQIKEIKEQD